MGCCYASYYINWGTGIESMVEEGVGEALTLNTFQRIVWKPTTVYGVGL